MSHEPQVKPPSRSSREGGFTLIEVIVAIVLIGASLLTVVGAASAAIGYQALARQEQVATTIATNLMEQLRNLHSSEVASGMPSAVASDTAHVSLQPGSPPRYVLRRCGGENLDVAEAIIITTLPTPAILTPHLVAPEDGVEVDGVQYGWGVYVTQPTAGDPFHATVCVEWSWADEPQHLLLQSWLWFSKGPGSCGERPASTVGGPCVTASASVPDGAVAIDVTHTPSGGTATTLPPLSFAIAGASSQIVLSDTTRATASYTAASSGSPDPVDEIWSASATQDSALPVNVTTAPAAIPSTATAGGRYTYSSVPEFSIRYLPGSASASAASSGSCLTPQVFAAATLAAACAASGVTRDSQLAAPGPPAVPALAWLDTRLAIGDTYYIAPIFLTSSSLGFKFGAYATAESGDIRSAAKREFTLIRLGGMPLGATSEATFVPFATMSFSDTVETGYVDGAAYGTVIQSPNDTKASTSPWATTNCSAISLGSSLTTAISKVVTDGIGCTRATTPAPSGTYTIKISAKTWWAFVPSTSFDEVDPSLERRSISSSSPTLELHLLIERTYCTSFRSSPPAAAARTECSGTAKIDTWDVLISLSLGTAVASWELLV